MKKSLKDIIKHNEKLHYLALCTYKFKDKKFRDQVQKIGHNMSSVGIVRGSGNAHDLPYVIEVGSSTIGFFALLRIVINALAYADYYALSPLVIFKDCVSYKENNPINGSNNPFEYYFEQTTKIDSDVYSYVASQASFLSCTEDHYSKIFELYELPKIEEYLLEGERLKLYSDIVRKYIKYNAETSKKLNADISSLNIECPFISVHYRGTDFKNNYGSHPVSIGVADYIESVKSLPAKYDLYPIFLATDDIEALNAFVAEFGERVIYYRDVKRADGNLSVICSEDTRENHRYLLGYEVIRDVETLSRASVIVAGLSQVANFARIFKLSRNEHFEYDKLMNMGVNHNNRSHITDIVKARKRK